MNNFNYYEELAVDRSFELEELSDLLRLEVSTEPTKKKTFNQQRSKLKTRRENKKCDEMLKN